MFAGMALSVRLFVYAGLSLFIISGPYLYMVVCVLYAYNLTLGHEHTEGQAANFSIAAANVLYCLILLHFNQTTSNAKSDLKVHSYSASTSTFVRAFA